MKLIQKCLNCRDIKMDFSNTIEAKCVLWYETTKSDIIVESPHLSKWP